MISGTVGYIFLKAQNVSIICNMTITKNKSFAVDLSPGEEAAAGVALGVVDEAGPGEPGGGAQQEVPGAGVAAEDPVVGGGVLAAGAAAGPARVEQRVGDELRGDPGRGARRPRVDGLVAGEEPGVLAAAAAAAGAAEPEPGAGPRASPLRLWLGS